MTPPCCFYQGQDTNSNGELSVVISHDLPAIIETALIIVSWIQYLNLTYRSPGILHYSYISLASAYSPLILLTSQYWLFEGSWLNPNDTLYLQLKPFSSLQIICPIGYWTSPPG